MTKTYESIGNWFDDCRALPEDEWDDIHLFTGEEGYGKSRKMRQIMRKLDHTFSVDRIHFTQDEFLDQAVTLDPGQAIVLDEWRGHKRLAMHGERMEFLDFTKECRGLGLHVGIGFPHVTQAEKDILFQRVRWWNHSPVRELLQVYKRISNARLDSEGHPMVDVRFKMVGKFPFPPDAPDPMAREYGVKKEARMRDRAARFREAHGKELQPAASRLNLAALEQSLAPAPALPKPTRLNEAFFDQVMADIKGAV